MLNRRFGGEHWPGLATAWAGDGRNPNAASTVFRRFDSASVVKGLLSEPPKTAWLIGYPLLERLHGLLVVGYDPCGNVGHQLTTRLHLGFARMEGESMFIARLPRPARQATRDDGYRGASAGVKAYVDGSRDGIEFDAASSTAAPTRSAICMRCWGRVWRRRRAGAAAGPAGADRNAGREPVLSARGRGAASRRSAARRAVLRLSAQDWTRQRFAPGA
jgi:hypothetical protein